MVSYYSLYYRVYGKALIEFIQSPGEVLYLPQGMPHSIHNIDDNIALTENHLFSDALPDLVKAITADGISHWVPSWNEVVAYHNLYMHYANKEDRMKMREMYKHITKLVQRYPKVCEDS